VPKNALGIAGSFSKSKSVEPYTHHSVQTPTFRRKLYIGRGLRCAIYIILSLSFKASQ